MSTCGLRSGRSSLGQILIDDLAHGAERGTAIRENAAMYWTTVEAVMRRRRYSPRTPASFREAVAHPTREIETAKSPPVDRGLPSLRRIP